MLYDIRRTHNPVTRSAAKSPGPSLRTKRSCHAPDPDARRPGQILESTPEYWAKDCAGELEFKMLRRSSARNHSCSYVGKGV
jgi:hypothetical protein